METARSGLVDRRDTLCCRRGSRIGTTAVAIFRVAGDKTVRSFFYCVYSKDSKRVRHRIMKYCRWSGNAALLDDPSKKLYKAGGLPNIDR